MVKYILTSLVVGLLIFPNVISAQTGVDMEIYPREEMVESNPNWGYVLVYIDNSAGYDLSGFDIFISFNPQIVDMRYVSLDFAFTDWVNVDSGPYFYIQDDNKAQLRMRYATDDSQLYYRGSGNVRVLAISYVVKKSGESPLAFEDDLNPPLIGEVVTPNGVYANGDNTNNLLRNTYDSLVIARANWKEFLRLWMIYQGSEVEDVNQDGVINSLDWVAWL